MYHYASDRKHLSREQLTVLAMYTLAMFEKHWRAYPTPIMMQHPAWTKEAINLRVEASPRRLFPENMDLTLEVPVGHEKFICDPADSISPLAQD